MLRLTLILCLLACCLTACFAADATAEQKDPTITVTAKVLGSDGKPVAGAQVLLTSTGQQEPLALTTDANGVFSAEVRKYLDWRARLGYAIVRANGLGLGGGDVKLEMTKNVITLTPARQLAGTVMDAAGKPVEGVALSLSYLITNEDDNNYGVLIADAWKNDYQAKTDAQGQWVINGLPSSGLAFISIDDPRFVLMQNRCKLAAGEPAPPFTVRPSGTITGRLLGMDGKPAAIVSISVNAIEGGGGAGAEIKTDVNGAFRLTRLITGKFHFHIADPASNGVLDNTDIAVKEGEVTTVPDIKLQQGALIDGTVLDDDTEQPVSGMWLVCSGSKDRDYGGDACQAGTDKQGHFRLRVLPGKRFVRMESTGQQYLRNDKVVEVDAVQGATQTISFRVKKGVSLSGTVVDEQGKPLPGIKVRFSTPNANSLAIAADADGAYQVSGLAKGQATLSIYDDFSTNIPTEWEIVQPKQLELPVTEPVKIICKKIRMATLTGRVVTPAGKPVDGAKVTLDLSIPYDEHAFSGRTSVLTTDTDGRFSLDKLKPGTEGTVQRVEKAGYRLVSAGAVQKKDIDLAVSDTVMTGTNGTASGRVLDDAGKPVADARVIALEDGVRNGAVTDAGGAFALKGLPEGDICLFAIQAKNTGKIQTVTNDKPVTITLKASPAIADFDEKRIASLLDDLCEYLKGAPGYLRNNAALGLAGKDPALAHNMAVSLGNTQEYMLTSIADRAVAGDVARALEWGVPRLAQMHDRVSKAQFLSTLGMAAIATDRDLAAELYRQLKELGAGDKPQEQALYNIQLLRFAGRLRNGEAEQQFDTTLKCLQQFTDNRFASQFAGAAAATSPALAEKVWSGLTDYTLHFALEQTIAEVVRYDLATATTLLEKMLAGDHPGQYYELPVPFMVVKALAKKDAAAALALANKPEMRRYRRQALIYVAESLPDAEALKVYQDAAVAEDKSGQPSAPQLAWIAAHLYDIDPVAGKKLFATVREMMDNSEYEWRDGVAAYAYYYSRVDPIESRLLLEAEFAQAMQKVGSNALPQAAHMIPLAMTPLDIPRALEMAREYTVKTDSSYNIFRDILAYLLATPEERKWGYFRCEKE